MGGVGVKKAAAIGTQLFDGDLRGRRSQGQGLLFGFGVFGDRIPSASMTGLPSASRLGV